MQNKGLRRNTIDKYYTNTVLVEHCINLIKQHVNMTNNNLIIEPSAGNGSFIKQIKTLSKYYGIYNIYYKFYDLEPEHEEVLKQDFLELDICEFENKYEQIHIIGNPPFGRQSSLAIKFIKKCCNFADSISFILPKSFKKQSMQKYFTQNYHLILEEDVADNSFLINDKICDVPCVFQIWIKKEELREVVQKVNPNNFTFTKKNDDPDISFRRVGVNAGTIDINIENKSEQSHYFIKFNNNLTLDKNIIKLHKIKFEFNNTVGPKSISKQELIMEFNKYI